MSIFRKYIQEEVDKVTKKIVKEIPPAVKKEVENLGDSIAKLF